jgi:hypothetical protein
VSLIAKYGPDKSGLESLREFSVDCPHRDSISWRERCDPHCPELAALFRMRSCPFAPLCRPQSRRRSPTGESTVYRLKAMPREEVTFTLECSGNNGLPFFQSGVGNARRAGASLAEILKAAQIKDDALEVVFWC